MFHKCNNIDFNINGKNYVEKKKLYETFNIIGIQIETHMVVTHRL